MFQFGWVSQSYPTLFTFSQLSYFFLHISLVLGPSPRCLRNFFLRWIPPQRPVGACPYCGMEPPSFLTPKKSSCACVNREVFFDLRSATLSLCFSKAQLLPLALSLECLGENKACILLCLIKIRCLAQGPIYLLPHSEGNDDRQSSLWPKSIMEKWIAISYFRARNKNSSETGLCSGSHLRKQLCTHFGEDPKTSQMWRKKPGNGPKVNEDPEGFTSLLCSSSLRTPALLSGCVSA